MSPLENFGRTYVHPQLKTFHTFVCPVYALDSRLQTGNSIPKWNSRCRLGLYLGTSPRHARSISLVLNLDTARISPQFHVIHDDFFESVDDHTTYTWSIVEGFKNPRRRPSTAVSKVQSLLENSLPRRLQPPSNDINDIQYDLSPPPLGNPPADDLSINDVPLALGENIWTADANETREEVTTTPLSSARPNRTSTRIKKPTTRYLDSVAQEDIEFNDFSMKQYTPRTCAFNATHLESPSTPAYYEALHQDDFRI